MTGVHVDVVDIPCVVSEDVNCDPGVGSLSVVSVVGGSGPVSNCSGCIDEVDVASCEVTVVIIVVSGVVYLEMTLSGYASGSNSND